MTPVRAPAAAVCWSPDSGWIFDEREAQRALTDNGWALMVASDGRVHVGEDETAPLAAMLRVDADVAELVERVGDLGDQGAALETAESVDVAELRTNMAALATRVRRLEGGT